MLTRVWFFSLCFFFSKYLFRIGHIPGIVLGSEINMPKFLLSQNLLCGVGWGGHVMSRYTKENTKAISDGVSRQRDKRRADKIRHD